MIITGIILISTILLFLFAVKVQKTANEMVDKKSTNKDQSLDYSAKLIDTLQDQSLELKLLKDEFNRFKNRQNAEIQSINRRLTGIHYSRAATVVIQGHDPLMNPIPGSTKSHGHGRSPFYGGSRVGTLWPGSPQSDTPESTPYSNTESPKKEIAGW